MTIKNKCVICGKEIPARIGKYTCNAGSKCYSRFYAEKNRERINQWKRNNKDRLRKYYERYRKTRKYKKMTDRLKKRKKALKILRMKHEEEYEQILGELK